MSTATVEAMVSSEFRAPAPDASRRIRWRVIFAATIGNLLEWYDYFVYAVLAITMSKLFFPTDNENTSLLLSLATYGSGLAMRPVGAIVLGTYADRAGRKAALLLAMMTMGLGTGMIVFAPSYETVGVAAPILILFARLLQGFSGAGELGSATALLIESAPERWRGFYASLNAASQQMGFVLAAFVVMIMTLTLSPAEIEAGGWRLPFLIGMTILPFTIYVRSKLHESAAFLDRRDKQRTKIPITLREGGSLLVAGGTLLLYVVAGNVLTVYIPTYAIRELGLPGPGALFATIIGTCVTIAFTPAFAAVSDRIGRKPLLRMAIAGYLLFTYPAFAVVTTWPSIGLLAMVQSAFAVLNAIYVGPLMSALAESFPTRARATAVSLSLSFAVVIGALSPAFAAWLIAFTGDARTPALVVMGAATVSGIALLCFRDRYREPLS
jgi:MHS family proline/betaine transporter-like MFS transporter